MKPRIHTRQRGVAVVTALLLTTLAITIVASLFWQQQVQVRSIENQRLQLQKQWILRGALDWTRLILREDKRFSSIDHLGEPWAVPLAETRLDQYVENASANTDVPDAALSGGIADAQARFNLTNLCWNRQGQNVCRNGTADPVEVAAFGRLLRNARQNPALAQAVADLMIAAQRQPQQGGGVSAPSAPQPLGIQYVDDLLAVPGVTPQILDSIRDFIVVLPTWTPINVNTAPAEVLAARIDTLSLSDAAALVAARENAWFRNDGEFIARLQSQGKQLGSGAGQIAVSTKYFLVTGNVRLNRAGIQMLALIDRSAQQPNANPKVVWIRED